MKDAKVRVKLESFNHELLNSSCNKMITVLQNIQLNSLKIVSLPTRKKVYCVIFISYSQIRTSILPLKFFFIGVCF